LDLADYIIEKESGGKMVWGDKDKKYKAFGIAQFQERTFNWLKQESGMPYLNWKNEQNQETLLIWALEHGYCYLWSTCPQKYK
jgi:hypothetical protein